MIEGFLHHEDIIMTRIKQKTLTIFYALFKLIINENNDTFKTKE